MFCYNASIILSQLLDYLGEKSETCQPLFNTKEIIVNFYLSDYKIKDRESNGIIKRLIIFEGRSKEQFELEKKYKGKFILPNKQERCGTFVFYPSLLSNISSDYFFGYKIAGEFICD